MKYLFPIGLSLLFCNISFSQEIWTLQDCIQFAMENNAEIKKQSCRNTISRLELERSKFDHLPTVTARIDHNLSSGRSLNTESYSWESSTKQQGNVIISSGLMIFNAFNKYYENREYFYSYLHENQSLKVIERDVTIKILSKYFEILFYHEQVDIYANQLDLSEKNISRITELIRSGHLAEGELFEVRSQTLKEEKQLTETKNRLDICYSDLYRLIRL